MSDQQQESQPNSVAPDSLDLPALNARFAQQSAADILRWAWETFKPHIALSSSFQTQSVPLLHLIASTCPEMPILFLDTGFHFPETLAFRDQLQKQLGLNVRIIRPSLTRSEVLQRYGEELYRRDPDLCCYIHKVEPMQRALQGMRAWISGVRRDQTAQRRQLEVLAWQSPDVLKIHPMLTWSDADVNAYRERYRLPAHPLHVLGYQSIGCAPCTRPVFIGEDPRAGRWAGAEKKECGLHLDWSKTPPPAEKS